MTFSTAFTSDHTRLNTLRKSLAAHASAINLRAAFENDAKRFDKFSAKFDDLLLDYSKCAIDEKQMADLLECLDAAQVSALRDAMFAGQTINNTEGRAVLHTALRAPKNADIQVDGHNVVPDIHGVLDEMTVFCDAIRSGTLKGATGQKITDVINIGIGGSDLGPAMATIALAPYHDGPRLHYVSNIDGAHIADTLKLCVPETTLVIVASKTFTTIETMTNAKTARAWIVKTLGEKAVASHFTAVSTALDRVADFGIDKTRIFGFWDWVGGRYSLWSAIGLPVMLAVGPDNFRDMLRGAHDLDRHFCEAEPAQNLPLLMGLIGWYHRVICEHGARAVIPYDQRLSRLPAYLQQLDMESNGKGVQRDGNAVTMATGPLVWGEPGTNGQHAFFQLLHQGTSLIPVEFIVAAKGHEADLNHQHQILLANCLAQSEALMRGRTLEEATAQLEKAGMDADAVEALAPHKVFSGNRPSLTLVHDQLTPYSFGRLVALYEHRVFVEAALFGINAFDQWGVELGKELATGLLPVVKGDASAQDRDASTRGLVAHIHALQAAS